MGSPEGAVTDVVITSPEVPDASTGTNDAAIARRAAGQVVVGFAAETGDEHGDVLEHGRAKLARKGCDLLVVNDVSGGKVFGSDTNAAVLLRRDGTEVPVAAGPKEVVADAVWDVVTTLWTQPAG